MSENTQEYDDKLGIARIEKRIKTAQAALDDAMKMLEAMKPASTGKKLKEADSTGAPFYRYLFKVPLPQGMQVQQRHIDYAAKFGFDAEAVHKMFNGDLEKDSFVQYYRKVGTKWQDWDLVFMKWIRTSANPAKLSKPNGQAPRTTRFDAIRNGKR